MVLAGVYRAPTGHGVQLGHMLLPFVRVYSGDGESGAEGSIGPGFGDRVDPDLDDAGSTLKAIKGQMAYATHQMET